MNNIIKAVIYRIFKSKAFIGCIIFSILDLVLGIIMNKAMYGEKIIYGVDSLNSSLTNNGTLAIIFLILMAILISEDYSSGAMKNIIGKGVNKLKYYIGNILAIMILYLVVSLIYSTVLTSYYTILNGFGSFEEIKYILVKSLVQFIIVVGMMFVVATVVIITKKTISGLILGCIILYIPSFLSILSIFIKLKFNFEIISLNYYQNIVATGSLQLKILIQAVVISVCYIILATLISNIILKKQEVK
ncbi:MAG: hypothetical protein ACRCTZ_11470 [Sarcina sp.]